MKSISIHRPTRAIISMQAIKDNIQKAIKHLDGTMEVFAVLKADAYGHGALAIAPLALEAGATGFAVATLDEAIDLRKSGIKAPVLVLEAVSAQYISLLQKYDIQSTLASMEWWEKAQRFTDGLEKNKPIKLHIKVDTGMGRLGFLTSEEVFEMIRKLEGNEFFTWEGIFTHFATADTQDTAHFNVQSERFNKIVNQLPKLPRYVHVSNSAATIWRKNEVSNMVRFGVGIYGLNPSGVELTDEMNLTPTLSLESELVQVKQLPRGEKVSYGATYTTSGPEWIGTVPLGYADGWIRAMQGFKVLVNGERCEIVGRVCMDQLMIRLPKKMEEGTKVTFIGKNGKDEITMQEVAEYMGTIHYEVACMISERVPRVYI